jgi:hypothetical protein
MEKPFVHLMRTPDETEFCLMGKEKVKPSALVSFEPSLRPSSLSTNCFSLEAMNPNIFCTKRI